VKLIQSEQECAKMKADQEKSEIYAKLEDAERKSQMAAQIEASCFGHFQGTINNILNKLTFSVDK
jgi:hypothetical protein